jgi:hypothetical protein
MELATLAVCLVGFAVLILLERNGMGQTEDLKSSISQLGVDLGEAVSRVEAKIGELGEPDPDLSAEIAKLRTFSQQLDSLAAEAPVPDPGPSPDPGPVPDPDPAPVPDDGGDDGGGGDSPVTARRR